MIAKFILKGLTKSHQVYINWYFLKTYSKHKNTWELLLTIIHLKKMFGFFFQKSVKILKSSLAQ